jgi:hypothetical protein
MMGRSLLALAFVVGCYHSTTPFDVPCTSTGECPTGQVCIAEVCVREGTIVEDADDEVDAAAVDASIDAPRDAAPPPSVIAWKSTTTANVPAAMQAMSITVPHPACAVGNVFVAAIAMGTTAAVASPVFTPPVGWTLVRRLDHGNDTALVMYWHVAAAGEPASYTWQITTAIEGVGWISCYTHVDTITPIDVEDGAVLASVGPSYAAPSVTTTVADAMVVATFVSHAPTNVPTTWTAPIGTTQRVDINNGTTRSGTNGDHLFAHAGATGVIASTASAAQDYAIVETLALRPAP